MLIYWAATTVLMKHNPLGGKGRAFVGAPAIVLRTPGVWAARHRQMQALSRIRHSRDPRPLPVGRYGCERVAAARILRAQGGAVMKAALQAGSDPSPSGRLGGRHHGYFLPSERASNIALALFSFPSLAAYEVYREQSKVDAECAAVLQEIVPSQLSFVTNSAGPLVGATTPSCRRAPVSKHDTFVIVFPAVLSFWNRKLGLNQQANGPRANRSWRSWVAAMPDLR